MDLSLKSIKNKDTDILNAEYHLYKDSILKSVTGKYSNANSEIIRYLGRTIDSFDDDLINYVQQNYDLVNTSIINGVFIKMLLETKKYYDFCSGFDMSKLDMILIILFIISPIIQSFFVHWIWEK